MKIEACTGPELPDEIISQYSLINCLSYIATKRTLDTTGVQKLYKVSWYHFFTKKYLSQFGFFDMLFKRLLVTTYEVYICNFLNLEMEFLRIDDAPNAKEYFERQAKNLLLNDTEQSLVFDSSDEEN